MHVHAHWSKVDLVSCIKQMSKGKSSIIFKPALPLLHPSPVTYTKGKACIDLCAQLI